MNYTHIGESGECPRPFYLDCGNGHCVRKAHKCDKINNCVNERDEKNCGLSKIEIAVFTGSQKKPKITITACSEQNIPEIVDNS
ncbi:hypothetical protein B4U79_18363 [Dinothrombium tinctorium]|uniref:Uncharacterized protein n=1 Tax=Dinothrombium tinctorium TaxID=1965070 RepID=A0A3S3PME5_9ACAR|nr:hypothetical protein B4U79_18363 [Dinothrombium tinctorium]